MSDIERGIKRLLLESAFCALSHRLINESRKIYPIFSRIIEDKQDWLCCEILYQIGIGNMNEASILAQYLELNNYTLFEPFFDSSSNTLISS